MAVAAEGERITILHAGDDLWIFKHYFEDKETFRELAGYYDRRGYRFVLKGIGERNRAIKILERRGFHIELAESTKGYVVKLKRYSRYAPVLRNSVAQILTPEWRIFLMKDRSSVEEALRLGAKMVEVDVRF